MRTIKLGMSTVWANLGLMALFTTSVFFLHKMTFVRTEVSNTPTLAEFRSRELPGFVHQSQNSPALREFRKRIEPLIHKVSGDLPTVVAIRQWVRNQQSDDPRDWLGPYAEDTEEPQKLVDEQRNGIHSACRRLAYIFSGALLSFGFDSRIVNASEDFRRSGRTHTLVEVWIESKGKWVLVDPSFDTLTLVDGQPASLADVYLAARQYGPQRVAFERDGSKHLPEAVWDSYRRYFNHMYVARTNAIFDGYGVRLFGSKRISFLHYFGNGTEPYPEHTKNFLFVLCAASVLILAYRAGAFIWYLSGPGPRALTRSARPPWDLRRRRAEPECSMPGTRLQATAKQH
jgi:hypothetical protein